jgi:low temperature requirement protein LtrA
MRRLTLSRRVAAPSADEGVTNLELFFDLVFVYIITQVTTVVRAAEHPTGYLQALAILVVTWWMYDGYCWLSNNIGPTTLATRVPMLVAMFGFLVMAVATPDVFHSGAWPFAIAYIAVVLVHGVQFARSSVGDSGTAILRVLPFNLAIGLALVVAAVLVPHDRAWIGWGAALVVVALMTWKARGVGFTVRPDHFAERHQLLIIIALGETVVATGAGAQGRLREAAVLITVFLAMVLLAGLWWVYFGGDDSRGAQALAETEPDRMGEAAFSAYSLVHLLHVIGLVLVAAGLHEVVLEPRGELELRAAVQLAAGTAVFLLAEAGFRRRLRIGSAWVLLLAAALCVVPAWLGSSVNGVLELALLGAVVVAALVVDPPPDSARA